MASSIKNVESKEEFDQFLHLAKDCVFAVHFWAPWSEACQQMNEVFEELNKSENCKLVKFIKVEAESVPELSLRYKIVAVPTFIFLKNEEVIDRLDGAYPPELAKKIKQYSSGLVPFAQTSTTSSSTNGTQETKKDLNSRLGELTNSYPCMVFMKGNALEPRCGFSKQLIALLNEAKADYRTFDILSDEEVRAGLKEYSQWPTYPQVYINGELIGGLDIVRELLENNELQSKLPRKQNLDERLKCLINKAPIMVFMKGDADQPRCGFSNNLMGILKDVGAKFETFDILQDEEVRQGLKTYSSWPTYPQVYVNGELIGGLDIVKEMQASGELKSALNI